GAGIARNGAVVRVEMRMAIGLLRALALPIGGPREMEGRLVEDGRDTSGASAAGPAVRAADSLADRVFPQYSLVRGLGRGTSGPNRGTASHFVAKTEWHDSVSDLPGMAVAVSQCAGFALIPAGSGTKFPWNRRRPRAARWRAVQLDYGVRR